MHTMIKFSPEHGFAKVTSSSEFSSAARSSSNEVHTLKFKYCKPDNDDIYDQDDDLDLDDGSGGYLKNTSYSSFMSVLSDDDVITFFNSEMVPQNQCISISISNTISHSPERRNNFSFCIRFNCNRKLPFVCKFRHSSSNKIEKANHSHRAEFYPDTLRNYQQDPKMSYVINALLAIAHGLDRIHQKVFF